MMKRLSALKVRQNPNTAELDLCRKAGIINTEVIGKEHDQSSGSSDYLASASASASASPSPSFSSSRSRSPNDLDASLSVDQSKRRSRHTEQLKKCQKCLEFEEFGASNEDTPFELYPNFDQLNDSAAAGCSTCRIFRKRILLDCASIQDVETMRHDGRPIAVENSMFERINMVDMNGVGIWQSIRLLKPKTYQPQLSHRNPSLSLERLTMFQEITKESQAAMTRALNLFKTCLHRHEKCRVEDRNLQPPKRLVDVGIMGQPFQARLIYTGKDEHHPYCALTYCWGVSDSANQGRTTRDNLEQRLYDIPESDVPRTILDAMTVARMLDIRYLWVDALCIIQDDLDDWRMESGKMAHIFGCATVTIAAAWASKGDDGIFLDRVAELYDIPPCSIWGHRVEEPSLSFQELEFTPLAGRAWCLQEEYLSRRVLYWSMNGLFWRCQETCVAEDGDADPDRALLRSFLSRTLISKTASATQALEDWYSLVTDYSERKITRLSDRLPAISGLAKVVSEILQDEYVAGFWRSDLWAGLQWFTVLSPLYRDPNALYVAPSWSWLSLPPGSSIFFSSEIDDAVSAVDILSVTVNPTTPDNFGPISSGKLEVFGMIKPLLEPDLLPDAVQVIEQPIDLRDEENAKESPSPVYKVCPSEGLIYFKPTSHPHNLYSRITFDTIPISSSSLRSYFLLAFCYRRSLERDRLLALVLEKVDAPVGISNDHHEEEPTATYRRVGIAWINEDQYFNGCEETIIDII